MIFEIKGSNEIGRKFLGSVVQLFLNNGFNLAIWQSLEKMEYLMKRLYILEIGFARIFAPSFKTFPERLSMQVALSIFISFNNFSIKPSVTSENLNLEESKCRIF